MHVFESWREIISAVPVQLLLQYKRCKEKKKNIKKAMNLFIYLLFTSFVSVTYQAQLSMCLLKWTENRTNSFIQWGWQVALDFKIVVLILINTNHLYFKSIILVRSKLFFIRHYVTLCLTEISPLLTKTKYILNKNIIVYNYSYRMAQVILNYPYSYAAICLHCWRT